MPSRITRGLSPASSAHHGLPGSPPTPRGKELLMPLLNIPKREGKAGSGQGRPSPSVTGPSSSSMRPGSTGPRPVFCSPTSVRNASSSPAISLVPTIAKQASLSVEDLGRVHWVSEALLRGDHDALPGPHPRGTWRRSSPSPDRYHRPEPWPGIQETASIIIDAYRDWVIGLR